jgi:aspartate/methionine/tyrosine aminotransferase
MTRDWALCRYLTKEKGVTAIPPSAFYKAENKHLAANLARFAYCKTDEVLIAADERFKSFFS